MRIGVRSALVLAVAIFVPAGLAAAQPSSAEAALTSLREKVLYAQYDEATSEAQALLARTDLSARTRIIALELLATAQIGTNNARAATQTLATLYSRDPGHRLSDPDASPPVQAAFARARAARNTPVAIRLEHSPPSAVAPGVAPELEVQVAEGSDAVEEVRLSYRERASDAFATVVMARTGSTARARIPVGPSAGRYEVQYFIEALAPSLTRLGSVGSSEQPLAWSGAAVAGAPSEEASTSHRAPIVAGEERRVIVDDEGGGDLLESPWFWVGVVAVVGAGAAGGYVLFGPPSEGPAAGSLGTVRLSPPMAF